MTETQEQRLRETVVSQAATILAKDAQIERLEQINCRLVDKANNLTIQSARDAEVRDAQAAQIAERDAQIKALRADAERWQKWLPWMRNINRKPYGLAREIDAIDAAMAAKE